jgi:hypothetical protein
MENDKDGGGKKNICKQLINLCFSYNASLQKDVDGGIDYAKRKVNLVRDKVEQLAQIIQTRQSALNQIQAFAAEKQQAAEAAA